MKRALALTSSLLILAGCGNEPAPPPPGGQSGDDGDVTGGPGGPPQPQPPGIPPSPCGDEATPLALDTATPFGSSALELVNDVAPVGQSPLFWVPFDNIPGVTFMPGPGDSAITITIEPRAGESATYSAWRPLFDNAVCPDDTLSVPVHVTLQSADGALDGGGDAELVLTSGNTATLSARIAMSALEGSFGFDRLGDPALGLVPKTLDLQAQLWPGGSRGSLEPSFEQGNQPAPPSAVPNPPPAPASSPSLPAPGIAIPSVPEHWRAVAVWPRRETCAGDGRGISFAYAPRDPVIGSSLSDIVRALDERGPFALSVGGEAASLVFDVEDPQGLRCATVDGRHVTFDVQATLSAAQADDSALARLHTTSVFEITATSAADGTLAELRWARRDLFVGESRSAFESSTGLTLDAPAEYEQLWWSWHASDTRESSSGPWSPRGALVVSSLNAEDAAEIARIQAQGGPGVGFTFDETTKFPVLPGDALIDAEIVP